MDKITIEFDLYIYNLNGEIVPARQTITLNKEHFEHLLQRMRGNKESIARWYVKRYFKMEKIEIVKVY